MEIRRAVEDDADAVAEVHVRSWQSAYRGLLPPDYLSSLSVHKRSRGWREQIETRAVDVNVAVVDHRVVGFVAIGLSRDADAAATTGEIFALYVLESDWDRGFGRSLLQHGERRLRQSNFSDAMLWVLEGNVRASRFYEAGGWRWDGTTKKDEIGGARVTEHGYRRDLTADS